MSTPTPKSTPVTITNPMNRASEDSQLPPGVIGELLNTDFYRKYGWFERLLEIIFRLRHRGVTAREELYYGLIQFISCLYVLAVVPQQLEAAGYNAPARNAPRGNVLEGGFNINWTGPEYL